MINPITNLTIVSVDLIDDQTRIIFSFVKPTGNIGGYYLFMSSTGAIYINVKTRVDSAHMQDLEISTYDSGGMTYFDYTLPTTVTDGQLLYFKIQALEITRAVSTFSDVVTAYTYPSKPTNTFITYDNYDVTVTWNAIDFTNGKNSTFTNYSIYRDIATEVSNFDKDEFDILIHPSFTVGKYLWIFDVFKRCQWFGLITSTGVFPLTQNKLTNYSDNSDSYTVNVDNLKAFIESDSRELVGTTSTGTYIDNTYNKEKYYIYSVESEALGSRTSNRSVYMCYTINVTGAYPYLRPAENSDTALLRNPYWRKLKEVLIDNNYYDKSSFAIPYAMDTIFNFKGYLGVSNCKLDVFVNKIYSFTTSTGIYGEFNINYTFKKEIVELYFQARDKENIGFSRKSSPYSIRTLNIYTIFATWGEQYKDAIDELNNLILDNSITTCRYASFEDKYSPFIELYKVGAEDTTKFLQLAAEIYKAFQHVGYDKVLIKFFDAFVNYVDNFESYQIYYNNSLFKEMNTATNFVSDNPQLMRGNYYYGVAAAKFDGQETPITEIRVDKRWWPGNYKGFIVLKWSEVIGAECYKIYRRTATTEYKFLISTTYTTFGDNNELIPDPNITPIDINVIDLSLPIVQEIYNIDVIQRLLKQQRNYYINILLFFKDSQLVAEYQLSRISFFLQKFIPPELKYNIFYANDKTVFSTTFVMENKYYCKGNIYSSGITLSISNEEAGYLFWENLYGIYGPLSFYLDNDQRKYPGIYGTTEYGYYDSFLYTGTLGTSRFGFLAYYHSSTLNFTEGTCNISWIGIGDDDDDIFFTYRRFANNAWLAWEELSGAVGTHTRTLTGETIQFVFMFNSTHWSDSDSVVVTSIA